MTNSVFKVLLVLYIMGLPRNLIPWNFTKTFFSTSGLWVKRQQVAWLQKYGTHKLEIPLPPLYTQAFAFLIKGYQQLSRQQGKKLQAVFN